MKRLLIVVVSVLALGACGKKEEAPGGAGPTAMLAASPEASAKQAEGAERRFLAYEHRVSLEIDAPQLERLYRELQDACVNEATWHCTVMDASIQLERDQRGGTAHLNLRASPEGVRAMRKRLADSGGVVSQGTHVDDLGQPIAEVGKRLEMLKNYRASLLDLQRKATKVEDLILIAEKLSETQSELEAASGKNAHLMDRVNREVLSIDLSTRQTAARSLWAPIGNAFREFLPALVSASASVISAVAYLLPWVIVLSIVGVLVARVRQKRRQQKSAD
ncbi:DUF4349 domain-containing protein [Ralstonia sp. 24A2]|uniref:DUF4349 domain-containing protein n=1 Tax=Ralstonia sp. 24A2 TaxID=3447364 RepID=UPI003F6A1455